MDWLDLLVVQGTLKSLLQHHSLKASVLQQSAFFIVQLSLPYMTTGRTIVLTRWTFVGKVMSLLFNMLSRLIIAFLPRSKSLLILWLQSPSAVILEPCILYLLFIPVSGIYPSGALDLLHLLIQKLRDCLRNMIGTKPPLYGTVSITGNRQWMWGRGAWWGLLSRLAGVAA